LPDDLTAKAVRTKTRRRFATLPSHDLCEIASLDAAAIYTRLGTQSDGLSAASAAVRLKQFGPNRVVHERRLTTLEELWRNARTPLNLLLLILAITSWFLTRDARSAIVIAIMVMLSVGLGFIQEHRSSKAAAQLARMVQVRATVRRPGMPEANTEDFAEIPLEMLVPGDIVRLSAGDMIPADLRLLSARDFYTNQSALTGESLPQEKSGAPAHGGADDPFATPNLCFMGASVVSGFATGVVVHTGAATCFGQLAGKIVQARGLTSFDAGIAGFAGLMIRFILVMAPAVFIINGLTKHDWLQAALFAVAVAVGLTPEMLPMIVTVNLGRGAMLMARRRVIVKRLNAIQNIGAMDVLCTDKTGTLTQDRIILKKHLDVHGNDDDETLMLAYLNSHFESGLKNVLDQAVLQHAECDVHLHPLTGFLKIDEIPFDFSRRRLSVVVRRQEEAPLLICKGAVEEVLTVCSRYTLGGKAAALDAASLPDISAVAEGLNADGFRVVAVATREFPAVQTAYSAADETGLTLRGFIAFLDPPKETASGAIASLRDAGVAVKIITGDNELVTRKICHDVGLEITGLLLGRDLETMPDADLALAAERANVFAKTSPTQKARIITALRAGNHVVGFLGDGINDGPALKEADVGVSVDTAVDIAKESADIILLDKNLAVLHEGVMAGRSVFANIIKYIRMGASSNFGNMFSMLGASIFLPFLPMLPIQVLTNNLLYDFSQTAIPTDNVDADYLARPRNWDLGNISRFMIFVGPISSIFDYATFGVMLYVFGSWTHPALFQTGWFVESLATQTLIVHIIRTAHVPFVESRASPQLLAASLIVAAFGAVLPFTAPGAALGFVALPPLYWPFVAAFLLGYAALTTAVKVWFIRRWGY
jgi:Mg2+-importing ATPase